MRAWLTRNRAGLIALLALVPALVVVLVVVPATDRAGRIAPAQNVNAGDRGTAAGLEFSVRVAAEFTAEGDGLDVPAGTSLVAAVVDVSPSGDSASPDSCEVTLSQPAGVDRRVWEQVFGESRFGYERGADFAAECGPQPVGTSSMELVFLTPSGVLDSSTVDIELRSGPRVETLRLALPAEL